MQSPISLLPLGIIFYCPLVFYRRRMATPLSEAVKGELFTYHRQRHLVAFRSGSEHAKRDLILLGGLTDALNPTPWTNRLADRLHKHNCGLVMPQLTSSGVFGWALGSLSRDAEEVEAAIEQIPCNRGVVLMGHSTGCQISAHALSTRTAVHQRCDGVVLQAPVSDRPTYPDKGLLEEAQELVRNGQGDELMPRNAELVTGDEKVPRVPILASRYASLAGRLGEDDYFSPDLSDDELASRFGGINVPLLLAPSAEDEAVPSETDQHKLMERVEAATGKSGDLRNRIVVIESADHAVSEENAQDALLVEVEMFLRDLDK